ncbi:MAG TPA: copper chaperone PCu(A)C [Streptosporangiaceae bacterium]|nr:copper chaperone PCu(A)C [Streptosporangiaceae bacterium]
MTLANRSVVTAGLAGPSRAAPRRPLRELAMAALAPLTGAVLLIGLLSAWVATGGAGTIARVRIQVTLAAIPMRAFTPGTTSAGAATTYLTIRNLSNRPDELLSASSPIARRIVLTTRPADGAAGPRKVVPDLVIPAHATITLSPFGNDAVLINPPPLQAGHSFPLTLTFRHGGTITIQAAITPPGAP